MRTAVEVVPKLGVKSGAPALCIGGVATYDRPIGTSEGSDVVDLRVPVGAELCASRYVRPPASGKREPAMASGRS